MRQTLKTAKKCCLREPEASSIELANNILRSNSYPFTDTYLPKCKYDRKKAVPLCVPYINASVAGDIIKLINRQQLPIHVVFQPPPNLKSILLRSRLYDRTCYNESRCVVCPNGRVGDCGLRGVVYRINCNSCGEMYIGETGRPLHIRIQEHVRCIRNPTAPSYVDSPWAKHVTNIHKMQTVSISVSVEAVKPNTLERKIKEALLIHRLRPTINCKDEMRQALQYIGRSSSS